MSFLDVYGVPLDKLLADKEAGMDVPQLDEFSVEHVGTWGQCGMCGHGGRGVVFKSDKYGITVRYPYPGPHHCTNGIRDGFRSRY